jgi:hypothetical protein
MVKHHPVLFGGRQIAYVREYEYDSPNMRLFNPSNAVGGFKNLSDATAQSVYNYRKKKGLI